MLDCIIIGMGPCGISCATYLKRANKDVLVIGKDLGALSKASEIENYYAVGKISGEKLATKGLKEAISLGINCLHDEVLAIEYLDNGYKVITKKNSYESKTIMLALGKVRNSFNEAKKFEGKGVSYCATCDGFFYRKKKIAIVGYNNYMAIELDYLLNLTKDIIIFTNGNKMEVDNKGLLVVEDKISSFNGENKLESITAASTTYDVDGCFIALGSQNAFTLAKQLGLEIKDNNLIVDNNYMTNVPGIFAGGDVIGGLLQVAKAVSDGAIASINIINFLKGVNNV